MKRREKITRILVAILISLLISNCAETGSNSPINVQKDGTTAPEKLPFDQRSYQLLEKFADKYPDKIYKGAISFTSWIPIDEFIAMFSELPTSINIIGICFRPTDINIYSCSNKFDSVEATSLTLPAQILESTKYESELYRMAMMDSEFYKKDCYDKLQIADIEIYATIVSATAQQLITLQEQLPQIRIINPGEIDGAISSSPIILLPELDQNEIH